MIVKDLKSESSEIRGQKLKMISPQIEETVPSTSRRQDAYETILHAIVFGELRPDARLDEKSLALDFGIGIAGVRDALFRLSLEGLVIRQPRIGTKVAGLDVQELQDVFESRVILECQCARIAALRADAHDVVKLRTLIEEYDGVAHTRDFRKLFEIDQIFHRTVAHSTKNRLLEQQVVVLHNNASRFWYIGVARLEPEALTKSLQSHIDVVNAISNRNAQAAEKAMLSCVADFPGFADHYMNNQQVYDASFLARK